MIDSQRIADNVAQIQARIAAAATRSGRDARAVTLIAVTKYADVAWTRAVRQAGCCDLGESRPQDLWAKAATLAEENIRWHLIGSLQRNKAKRTAALTTLIHSVDSLRLLESLSEAGARLPQPVSVLLEIRISRDATKQGFDPEKLEPLFPQIAALPGVRVCGAMGMASLDSGPDGARREFAALRGWRDRWRRQSPPELTWHQLSMGMSGDYEIAIEEGATLVRVGSALFEGIDPA